MFRRVRFEDFKFFQTLHAVKERIAHRGVFAPIFCENFLCVFRYRNDRNRDNGNAHYQNDRHFPIYPHAYEEQNKRRDHRIKELRKIGRIIKVELFDAFHGNLRKPCHVHSVGTFYAERKYLVVGLFAKVFLDFTRKFFS